MTPWAVNAEFVPKAEKEGFAPVLPVNTWPSVPAVVAWIAEVPSPIKTPWLVKVVAPVPPLGTVTADAVPKAPHEALPADTDNRPK